MTVQELRSMALAIKEAFEEGYNSYATPANAFNTVSEAWNESGAKHSYDSIMEQAARAAEATKLSK